MTDRPILFIHGALHGAWCWQPAIAALAARGRKAVAIDLPGQGEDPTPLAGITLSSYADRILQEVKAIGEPVTLVGHSLGGLSTTVAAARADGGVAALIYVAAIVPIDGEAAADLMAGISGGESAQPPTRTEDGAGFLMEAPDAIRRFYQDCDPAAAADAAAMLTPQAFGPIAEKAAIGAAIDAVPSGYILARADAALPPEAQRFFATRRPDITLVEIEGGHSPFLKDPVAFADTLLGLEARL